MKEKVELGKRERWMKCYARLFAHMAGFAAINAGATMQQLSVFHPENLKIMTAIPIIITQAVIMVVFGIFGAVRERAKRQAVAEGRAGRRAKMMSEEVFEAENDISSLSMSFLMIQVARYCLSGSLPNPEGLEEPELPHSVGNIVALYVIGLACAALACVLVVVTSKQHQGEHGLEEADEESLVNRLTIVGLNASSMCFAWAVLWGTRWVCFKVQIVHLPSIMGRVVMALILSAVSCVAVFGLDVVDDAHKGSEDSKGGAQAIQMLVNSLGILIGFSWEHSFDGGVAAVASMSSKPSIVKFILGVVIVAIMTPMWRKHILTKEIALEKRKEDKEMAAHKMKGGHHKIGE